MTYAEANTTPTLRPHRSIFAVQVLAKVRDQANKLQFAIFESCLSISMPCSPLRIAPPEPSYIRVALA